MSAPGAAGAGLPASAALSRTASYSGTTFPILLSLSLCHMLNDMNQSLVPAIYPVLKETYHLDFAQIGLITLAFQFTASMLQPIVGTVTDFDEIKTSITTSAILPMASRSLRACGLSVVPMNSVMGLSARRSVATF